MDDMYESGGLPVVTSTLSFPAVVEVPTIFLGDKVVAEYNLTAQATKTLPHVLRYSPAKGKGGDIYYDATNDLWSSTEPENSGRFYTIGFSYPNQAATEPVESDDESDDLDDESGI